MNTKLLIALLSTMTLFSCGSDDDDKSPIDIIAIDPNLSICSILLSTVSLIHGESCRLTKTDADLFSVSAGSVECDNGIILYEENQLTSGQDDATINGLTFTCTSDESTTS